MTEPNFGGKFDSWNFETRKTKRPASQTGTEPVTALRVPTTLDSWLEINERSHEPTNEELGIKPWTAWRLVTFWLCAGVFSCAVFWGIGEALLAVLS